MNTDWKQELFISFFLLSQTQSLSILETKRTKIGRGRGGILWSKKVNFCEVNRIVIQYYTSTSKNPQCYETTLVCERLKKHANLRDS